MYEHPKFFTAFEFHKLKLIYHRATMKKYYHYLKSKKLSVQYIEYQTKKITDKNECTKKLAAAIFCCIKCCLWCIEKFMKFLNKKSYWLRLLPKN